MRRTGTSICAGLAVSVFAVGICACEKNEGPAERAGKQVDKAVEEAKGK